MKRTTRNAQMSADAYAGFLRLFLARNSEVVDLAPDVKEYLGYVERREPLTPPARRALGTRTVRAA